MTKTTKSTSTRSSTRPTLSSNSLCRVHVSQPAIRKNLKDKKAGLAGDSPAISVKSGSDNIYGHEVIIYDKEGNVVAKLVQPKDQTLNCGARIWIECYTSVAVRERKEDHILVTELSK